MSRASRPARGVVASSLALARAAVAAGAVRAPTAARVVVCRVRGEMDVDIRGWSFLSKQGLFTLLPSFKDILVEIGFVIEGRDDDEMPEVGRGLQ